MKSGRRPTNKQKSTIKEAGHNPCEWLVVKNLSDQLHIVHRNTGQQKAITNK